MQSTHSASPLSRFPHPRFPYLGAITYGTSPLGYNTQPGSPEERKAIDTALALLRAPGYVDTSNAYAQGRSEQALGAALRELTGEEKQRAIDRLITKVDCEPGTGRFDGDRVRESLDESLERLGIDRVRHLHLHDPYSITFAEASGTGGAIDALVALRDEGVVDTIGIAAGRTPVVERYVNTGVFDMVLTHNRYTLVDHSAANLLANAHERGMITFNAAPFGGDLLAKGSVHGRSYAYTPATDELREWVVQVENICAAHSVPLAAVALHESMRAPHIASSVVGVNSVARLEQLVALATTEIPDAVYTAIAQLGPAPTPIADDPEEYL
ncbi:aldo/keto reductase [Microbacterium sp. YY-01]|uniref:aldo/keto reductase n=1 Tax=Microbacterium sp. YY-01 TaxID=3421634 RepID=UPI003D167A66